jgi:4-amino-4-deoxy-L-arabinose transferase-like glycosyltransferase
MSASSVGGELTATPSLVPIDPAVPPDDFNRITRLIARASKLLWIYLALLYLISFNGQWRIGLDSANYRGLGHSLATGRGYSFGDWAPHNVYPGFPLLLAALEKLFGSSAIAPCIAMLAVSILTIVLTYRLIRLHYPKWIAVTVSFGLATNSWYLQQTSELMTDVPFLLGVVAALYGWDLLRLGKGSRIRSMAILVVGLAIAATTRPTFLILVGAWGAACAWGLIRGTREQRRMYAIALGTMFLSLDRVSRVRSAFARL